MTLLILAWLKGAAAPFLIAAGTAFVQQWLRNKALVDAGATAQRSAQAAADAAAVTKARGVADEVRALSDADFARRAGGFG